MSSKLSPLREVVKSVFARMESEGRFSKESIDAVWEETAGVAAFRHSRPAAFQRKVLIIQVDSSAWLQELSMKKRTLLKGLKRALGKDRIVEIHFKIGESEWQK